MIRVNIRIDERKKEIEVRTKGTRRATVKEQKLARDAGRAVVDKFVEVGIFPETANLDAIVDDIMSGR